MLCRHSVNVLELLMVWAGREDLLVSKSVKDCRIQLQQAMRAIDYFEVPEKGGELAC